MNKEYVYIDDKVIISDEKDNKRPDVYYDNLDEVLVKENIIESLEVKQSELEKEAIVLEKKNKKNNSIFIPRLTLCTAAEIIGFIPLFYLMVGNVSGVMVSKIVIEELYNMNLVEITVCAASVFLIPISFIVDIQKYFQQKVDIKREKGIKLELENLNKMLNLEKENLEKLKLNKQNTNTDKDFRIVKVNHVEELKKLKKELEDYYNEGYNKPYLDEAKIKKFCVR